MPETVGTLKIGSLLTARLYEPKDKSLSIEFLKAHPVTTHPKLYREVKGGRRQVKDRVVTDAFCAMLVDELQSSQPTFSTFKWHHSGTGTTAEAAAQTDLVTPVSTRDEGSLTETSAKVFKSVGTTTYSGTSAITEHGLFSAETSGTMMDRSKFDAINVVSGNQIEWTYELTVSSGG